MSDIEYNPSGNSNSPFDVGHVGYLKFIVFLYDFFIFMYSIKQELIMRYIYHSSVNLCY